MINDSENWLQKKNGNPGLSYLSKGKIKQSCNRTPQIGKRAQYINTATEKNRVGVYISLILAQEELYRSNI